MIKNKKLSKSISDASWSRFVEMLKYKSEWYGRTFHQINRWYPSSKTCSSCGHLHDSMPLNIRNFSCEKCHAEHDRDINAAKNILTVGHTELACGEPVRQTLEVLRTMHGSVKQESPCFS